jgi:hypothetical protein
MTQFNTFNDEQNSIYTRPTLDFYICNKYWSYLTKGMSSDEIQDFQKAKEQLENYNKIYTLVEYSSELNDVITVLERKIQT